MIWMKQAEKIQQRFTPTPNKDALGPFSSLNLKPLLNVLTLRSVTSPSGPFIPASKPPGQSETSFCAVNASIGVRIKNSTKSNNQREALIKKKKKVQKFQPVQTGRGAIFPAPAQRPLLWRSLHRRVMASNAAPRDGPNAFLN